jgi:beta-lactamase regulating signal transducer with metallopeptidase domain/protocatechuate 3,4-dioxygenase beta subunit
MNDPVDMLALWLADYYFLSTALLIATLAALEVLRQPAQRLVVAKAALVAVTILAALCATPGWSVVHLLSAPPAETLRSTTAPSTALSQEQVDAQPAAAPATAPTPRAAHTAAPATEHIEQPVQSTSRITGPTIRSALAGAFLLGSGAVIAWLAIGALVARRLVRDAEPAPLDVRQVFADLAGEAHTTPNLRISRRVDTAVALGVWRPVVLLPTAWLDVHTGAELRSILAHELAHVRNGDLRWLAIGRALVVLLWAQPLYWLVRRRMRLDQEVLADAAAAALSSRQRYAQQLVDWARTLPARPGLSLHAAVGLWEGPSQLRRRVTTLLDEQLQLIAQCSRRWRWTAGAALAAAAVGLSCFTFEPRGLAAAADDGPAELSTADESTDVSAEQVPQPEQDDDLLVIGEIADATVTVRSVPIDALERSEPNVIAGQFVDQDDRPLAGVDVSLEVRVLFDAPPKRIAAAQTDRDGRFRFDVSDTIKELYPDGRVPTLDAFLPEPLVLRIAARSPGRVSMEHSMIASRVGRTGIAFRHQMLPAATLRGRVTGPDGKPVEGAVVSVSHLGAHPADGTNSARTDADGRYTIDDLAPFDAAEAQRQEKAQLEMHRRLAKDSESATAFWIGPAAMQVTVEHPDFAIRRVQCTDIPGTRDVALEPGATITGRVVDASGAPVGSAKVLLAKSRPTPDELAMHGTPPVMDDAGNYLHYAATTTSDTEGRYRFGSLPAGKYDLWVELNSWQYPGVERVDAVAEQVTDAPAMVVTKGGTIGVRLVDDATGQPIPLKGKIEARFLLLTGRGSGPGFHRAVSRPVAKAADGQFAFEAYPGSFRIGCDYVLDDGQIAWLSTVRNLEEMPAVTVVDGQSAGVELRVRKHEPPPQAALSPAAANQLQQAHRLLANGEYQQAIELSTQIIKENYPAPAAWMVRAEARKKLGQIRALIVEYDLLLQLELPRMIGIVARNNLACLLATTAEDQLRDGRRAVQLAEEALALAGDQPPPDLYDTLAAAYAETGDFQRAIQSERKAIDSAPAAEQSKFRGLLQLYESGQPLRETPSSNAAGPIAD